LRWGGNFYSNLQIFYFGFRQGADFHSQRGIWRESEGEFNSAQGFLGQRIQRPDWAKRFCFLYNSKTQVCHDAPVAQLDRVHGYEP
jgi:hypothetical protein